MQLPPKVRTYPGRLTTGAFLINSGLEKWGGGQEQAAGIHGMATNAFPFLKQVPPSRFLRALSAWEVVTGAALLVPLVPRVVAGAALTAFSGGLTAFYLRAPGLRKPGGIRPSSEGTAVSKDVWMLGIGVGMMLDRASEPRA